MTQNRMGSTRRSITRKAWVTGTLALGVVAASGAVASAALHHEAPSQKISLASASGEHAKTSSAGKGESEKGDDRHESEGPSLKLPKGPVCLKLDSKAQKAISEAEAAAGKKGTVLVPLDKVEVVACQEGKPSAKPSTAPSTAPTSPAPKVTLPTVTPAPVKTTTPPKTVTPVPTVTTTAS